MRIMKGLEHNDEKFGKFRISVFKKEYLLEIFTKIEHTLWNYWKILKPNQFWRNFKLRGNFEIIKF